MGNESQLGQVPRSQGSREILAVFRSINYLDAGLGEGVIVLDTVQHLARQSGQEQGGGAVKNVFV